MWEARRAYESPSRCSITSWWEKPIPSTKRPQDAAWVVSACCAIATGWRG